MIFQVVATPCFASNPSAFYDCMRTSTTFMMLTVVGAALLLILSKHARCSVTGALPVLSDLTSNKTKLLLLLSKMVSFNLETALYLKLQHGIFMPYLGNANIG